MTAINYSRNDLRKKLAEANLLPNSYVRNFASKKTLAHLLDGKVKATELVAESAGGKIRVYRKGSRPRDWDNLKGTILWDGETGATNAPPPKPQPQPRPKPESKSPETETKTENAKASEAAAVEVAKALGSLKGLLGEFGELREVLAELKAQQVEVEAETKTVNGTYQPEVDANGYVKIDGIKVKAKGRVNEPGQPLLEETFLFSAWRATDEYLGETEEFGWLDVLKAIEGNPTTFLCGKPGIAKTTVVEQLAVRLGQRVYTFQCEKQTVAESLIGQWVYREGKTQFQYGPLVDAWRLGWWFVLDEGPKLNPDVTSLLYGAARGGALYLAETGEVIPRHPNARLIVTGNTNGEVDRSGRHITSVQDAAWLERLNPRFWVTFPVPDKELQILKSVAPGLKTEELKAVQEVIRISRELFAKGDLLNEVSTRTAVFWVRQIEAVGWRKAWAFLRNALGHVPGDSVLKAFDDACQRPIGGFLNGRKTETGLRSGTKATPGTPGHDELVASLSDDIYNALAKKAQA